MIKLSEIFKPCKEENLATTETYLKVFSKFSLADSLSEDTKDFRRGLDIGFNYALAMIKEELGSDYWKNKKTDIPMVRYYSALVNLQDKL